MTIPLLHTAETAAEAIRAAGLSRAGLHLDTTEPHACRGGEGAGPREHRRKV